MSWGAFYGWTVLSLQKIAKAGIEAASPGMLVELDGARGAADEGDDEWCRVTVLQAEDQQRRAGEWIGPVMLQISVFSRFGDQRQDRDTNRPRKLAGLIAGQIANQAHEVRDWDAGTPAVQGQVFLHAPSIKYLDEMALAQTGVNQSVPSGIHAAAMTFHGRANKY